MRARNHRNLEARNAIVAARTTSFDMTTPVGDLGSIASDAAQEGRTEDAIAVIASVPPVTLHRTIYTVAAAGRYGMTLIGPRGGESHLVQNSKRPELFAHNTMSGYSCRTTWYRRNADGTFTAI